MQNATKLYACFDVYYDYCDYHKELIWITDNEKQAKDWVDSFDNSEKVFREYNDYLLNEANE